MCFLTLLSDISAVIFGKKASAKSKTSPGYSAKMPPTTDFERLKYLKILKAKSPAK